MIVARGIRMIKIFLGTLFALFFVFQIMERISLRLCFGRNFSKEENYVDVKEIKEESYMDVKDTVVICVGILSKLSAFDRREAIRLTWMRYCSHHRNIVCRFFTDVYDEQTKNTIYRKVLDEDRDYSDITHMPLKGGHIFTLRLLWMLQWFTSRYKFDYFLRIDDDYYLCVEHLLHDLAYRPKQGLYWGYLHCREHVVRIDEGFLILSYDIINESLQKLNTTLKCHPFGDQAVALWVQESALAITYFADNERVIHAATSYNQSMFLRKDICERYIGLHGAYPQLMYKYWILSHELSRVHRNYENPIIKPFGEYCKYDKKFDYRWFWPHVRFEPKLCRDNPTWSVTNQKFRGREEQGKEAIY